MHAVLFSLVLLTVGAGSSLSQQVPKSTDASIVLPPGLARVLTDYEVGWKAGDAAALARLFTEDGFVLSPGKPPVRGRAAMTLRKDEHGRWLIVSDMDNSNRRRE